MAILGVSGLLGAVGNLVYHGNNKTLEWREPFHLITSDAISYEFLVVLVPNPVDVSTDDTTVPSNTDTGDTDSNHLQTTSKTFVNLTGQVDDHFSYTVSVWAVNIVGKSEAAVIQIPSTKSELILHAHTRTNNNS